MTLNYHGVRNDIKLSYGVRNDIKLSYGVRNDIKLRNHRVARPLNLSRASLYGLEGCRGWRTAFNFNHRDATEFSSEERSQLANHGLYKGPRTCLEKGGDSVTPLIRRTRTITRRNQTER